MITLKEIYKRCGYETAVQNELTKSMIEINKNLYQNNVNRIKESDSALKGYFNFLQ